MLPFIYIKMEELRTDIENEMKRVRINKSHVYNTLLRMINVMDANSVSSIPAVSTAAPVEDADESVTSPPAKKTRSKSIEVPSEPVPDPTETPKPKRGRVKKTATIATPEEETA